jgi:hypothetical protein
MLKRDFPIPLERWMTGVAILAILLGAIIIAFVGWTLVGAVIVFYGVLFLFLAYHMGAAPCIDETETGEWILRIDDRDVTPADETGEMQPDWLTEYEARNPAN